MKNLKEIRELKLVKGLDFIAKTIVEGFIAGLHKSPYHGFSVEFSEHRPYNKGESIRFIDWRLYARTEKLFVKKFEQETNLRNFILLDISSSMLFPIDKEPFKLEYAVYISAALIYLFQRQRDASGLILFSDSVEYQTEAKLNTLHINLLISKLQEVLDNRDKLKEKKTSISDILHYVAERLPKRSLVVLFTDFLVEEDIEELVKSFEHLKYNYNEIVVFYVVDKKYELNLDFGNQPYKFIDLETGDIVKLNPISIQKEYREKIYKFVNELKEHLGQIGVDLVEVDISSDFAEVLTAYLLKRQKMY